MLVIPQSYQSQVHNSNIKNIHVHKLAQITLLFPTVSIKMRFIVNNNLIHIT